MGYRSEGGAEEGAQLVAEVPEGDDVGRPADGAKRFRVGGDARDGRRGEHGDQTRVSPAEAAGLHLHSEIGDRPVDERLQVVAQPLGPGLGEPAQLANEPEQRRRPHGGAEHGHDDRVDAVEGIVGRRPHRCLDRRG